MHTRGYTYLEAAAVAVAVAERDVGVGVNALSTHMIVQHSCTSPWSTSWCSNCDTSACCEDDVEEKREEGTLSLESGGLHAYDWERCTSGRHERKMDCIESGSDDEDNEDDDDGDGFVSGLRLSSDGEIATDM